MNLAMPYKKNQECAPHSKNRIEQRFYGTLSCLSGNLQYTGHVELVSQLNAGLKEITLYGNVVFNQSQAVQSTSPVRLYMFLKLRSRRDLNSDLWIQSPKC